MTYRKNNRSTYKQPRLFDKDITLIKEEGVTLDKYGNEKPITSENILSCNELNIFANDFYSSGIQGYKLEARVEINEFEYQGENKAVYNGRQLFVLRKYKNGEFLELTLGEKIGK